MSINSWQESSNSGAAEISRALASACISGTCEMVGATVSQIPGSLSPILAQTIVGSNSDTFQGPGVCFWLILLLF